MVMRNNCPPQRSSIFILIIQCWPTLYIRLKFFTPYWRGGGGGGNPLEADGKPHTKQRRKWEFGTRNSCQKQKERTAAARAAGAQALIETFPSPDALEGSPN